MSQVNEIKDAVDIVSIIGERLDLKRSGSSYKALCPFHSENSPSFFVNPEIQRYKCFGCGASGDVIEFLEQYEGMSFLEALENLADRAGIELKKYQKTQDDKLRETLLQILELSSRYYHYLLTEHKLGEKVRDYLKNRGINQASIKLFQLGCALPAWDGLTSFLTKKKNFKPETVLKTGLILKSRTGRYYDRFRNRVVFPLKNHRGQIVGFSGRILNKDEDQPKYINTPETKLYHKAKTLYGYHELYQEIRKKKEVIVTEGEFDVISSSQVHVGNIVAIKGSALTEGQAKLLNRTVDKVVLSLDSDQAGVKATKRAIEVIRGTGLDLRVIDLSNIEGEVEAKDADELIHQDPNLWKEVVKSAMSAYDFLIDVNLRKYQSDSASGRRHIIDELAPVLNNIEHQVEKDFYLKKLAEKLRVSSSIIADDIRNFGQKKRSHINQRRQKNQTQDKQDNNPIARLEDYLLFLLFNFDQEDIAGKPNELAKLRLHNPEGKALIKRLLQYKQEYQLKDFARTLPEDLKAALMRWVEHPEFASQAENIDLKKEWGQSLDKYRQLVVKKRIDKINDQIRDLERIKDKTQEQEQKLSDFLNKIVQLQQQVKTNAHD